MNEQQIELQVTEANVSSGKVRLDKFLAAEAPALSRTAAQRLIGGGQVTVNGEPVRASYKVRAGDLISVRLPAEESSTLVAEAIPLDVVYEDEALLVVNKPAGMVVHPAPGHPGGTLVNALLAHCPELATDDDPVRSGTRPGIVHRLDRDTSGLILVAKSEKVRRALQPQFKDRQVHKAYLALLDGHLQPAWGRIKAPLGRDPQHRQRMAVLPGGREAITDYHVLEQFAHQANYKQFAHQANYKQFAHQANYKQFSRPADFSLVQAEPQTGRTHQIRVHFASIGHPVVGDAVYGRRKSRLPAPRQFLHAQRLGFKHPLTGRRVELEAPLPDDLAELLALLRVA